MDLTEEYLNEHNISNIRSVAGYPELPTKLIIDFTDGERIEKILENTDFDELMTICKKQ